jgi:8-amino-3,8-dideoxy-alpha-D-manno-octulosonate transaminase
MKEQLAINGGEPVRSKPLPPMLRGAMVYGEEETEHVAKVVAAGSPFRYYGPNLQGAVEEFERLMAERLNVSYVLGVSSCTAALIVALKALGIGYGDKVIVPANTFTATAGAVVCANAVPVFVDMDDTLNMDVDDLERVMDDEVKAIIAVHINGSACDMDRVMAFARKYDLPVIEDVAQSLGCTYKGRYCGTIGDIGVYSFQMQKILTAGEGGAVVTNSPELFERAARYHDQGNFRDKGKYQITPQFSFIGQNYRMSEMTGAVMIEQWKKLDTVISAMQKHHLTIREALNTQISGIRIRPSVDLQGDVDCVFALQHSTKAAADAFMAAMNAENIFCFKMYGGEPIYMQSFILNQKTTDKDNFPFNFPFQKPIVYSKGMCPHAEDLLQRTTLLPVSPIMTEEDTQDIINAVVKVCKGLQLEGIAWSNSSLA